MAPPLKQIARSNKWLRKKRKLQKKEKQLLEERKLHLREEKQLLRKRKKQQKKEEDNKFNFIISFLFLSIFFLKKRDLKSQKRGNIPRFFYIIVIVKFYHY